jgi:hypothetical protein
MQRTADDSEDELSKILAYKGEIQAKRKPIWLSAQLAKQQIELDTI